MFVQLCVEHWDDKKRRYLDDKIRDAGITPLLTGKILSKSQ
jgi:hypothetical protein